MRLGSTVNTGVLVKSRLRVTKLKLSVLYH